MRAGATRTVRVLALGVGACGVIACAAGPVDVTGAPPSRSAVSAPGEPWVDAQGADHRARDAVRRAAERAARAGHPAGDPAREVGDLRGADDAPPRDASRSGPVMPGGDAHPAGDDALDAVRRRGERERDARRQRGSIPTPPPATPRVQPDAPAAPPTRPPPRIAIPGPGEPGGPPVPLPGCGPAGCVDANGRPMPRVGGSDVLIGPGGRPCVQIGAMASC